MQHPSNSEIPALMKLLQHQVHPCQNCTQKLLKYIIKQSALVNQEEHNDSDSFIQLISQDPAYKHQFPIVNPQSKF